MPNEEKEQLYKDVNPKMQAEIAASKETEEVKTEEPVAEEVKEEPVKEAPVKTKGKLFKSKEKLADAEEVKEETSEELSEEKTEDIEEVKAEVKEELSEEAEPVEEEKPAEEAKEEEEPEAEAEVKEEVKEEVAEEESLAKEAEETKEELSVIREVRDELVVLYSKNKEVTQTAEKLSAEVETLKSENKTLSEQLAKYEAAEAEINATKRQERLEALSAKFTRLGQEKSVEQLSKKDAETLSEFEKIVDAALDKTAENTEQLSETDPSQGEEVVAQSEETAEVVEETKVEAPKAKPVEQKNEQFFAGILNQMADQQDVPSTNNKVKYF